MLESKKNRYIIVFAVIISIILFKNISSNDIVLLNNDFIDKDNSSVAKDSIDNTEIDNEEKKIVDKIDEEIENNVYIHISGNVRNPGIYEMKENSRLIDAVNKAGGLIDGADLDRINLARKLKDEDKIYIPKVGEEISNDINTNLINNTSEIEDEKIDINTCSKEELIKLPGIGEKTADKIIEYRSEIKFSTIEDIMEVKGIGQKKFEEISKYIIVR